MPLNKSHGDMYSFCSHTHSHLAGACPHACSYCYVQDMGCHYHAIKTRYTGPLRLTEKEFEVNYGNGKTIFIENCNDLWAEKVPTPFILRVLDHCAAWPDNTYVYQTKNPRRFSAFVPETLPTCLLGCTIETNRDSPTNISWAPRPIARMLAMERLSESRHLFVTIEPIMRFDVDILTSWMFRINPAFVIIGADSKGHHLPEPTRKDIETLIRNLKVAGIEVRQKKNLRRLLKMPNALLHGRGTPRTVGEDVGKTNGGRQ